MRRVLLSWSSGKDCAWALNRLRQEPEVELVGLLTTFNEAADRVAMHAVRRELVEAQAEAAGLPLWSVPLPWPCSNAEYESRMAEVIQRAQAAGVTHMAFGDLFLEEVREYRIRQLAGSGIEPWFPLWGADTSELARTMVESGLGAVLTCVDLKRLAEGFVGRRFDASLLVDLPLEVDPCGERGEFHTFCTAGPMFTREIPVRVGVTLTQEGFCFADLLPGTSDHRPAAHGSVRLRDVAEKDLPLFFEHQRDPVAARLVAFTPRGWDAFCAHWAKTLSDPAVTERTILFEEQTAGSVVSFDGPDHREVGYWLGREFWGRGIASEALRAFLEIETARPLFAHVAKHNSASLRVLEKCGFAVIGEDPEFARVEGEVLTGWIFKLE